jgi:phage terminase large subunit-like protein
MTLGGDAVKLAAAVGLHLDPWQKRVLDGALGERADGRWSAFEVGLIAPRQNGKGGVTDALELAALFLFGEKLILHSAHEFKTCREAFVRVRDLVNGSDHLRKRVKRMPESHGDEGVELLDGARLRFIARSNQSGRGMSPQRLILDEAQVLSQTAMAAMLPALSAQKNPQVWYTATPGDYLSAPCEQLAHVRRRGIAGSDPTLAFFEWSVDYDDNGVTEVAFDDPKAWAVANPALGIRISHEHVANELRSMPSGFARERLGVGRWPLPENSDRVIDEATWTGLTDRGSQVLEPVAFAVDMTPERSHVAVAVAGVRADGRLHVEVAQHRPGTRWVADELLRLQAEHDSLGFWIDRRSPAGSMIAELEDAGVEVRELATPDVVKACGNFFDAAMEDRLRHIGQPVLDAALAAARKRKLSDAWAWDRSSSGADICPLVAATNALHGFNTSQAADYDVMMSAF